MNAGSHNTAAESLPAWPRQGATFPSPTQLQCQPQQHPSDSLGHTCIQCRSRAGVAVNLGRPSPPRHRYQGTGQVTYLPSERSCCHGACGVRGRRAGDAVCAGSRPLEEHARIKLSVLRGSVQTRDAACETKEDRQDGGDQRRELLFMATCADMGTKRKLFPPHLSPEVLPAAGRFWVIHLNVDSLWQLQI